MFKNLIPSFVAKKLASKENRGSFNGISLFLDISGFTKITESLMEKSKEGAEIISIILDDIFSPIVDSINSNGGFVANFIGDAINAIFPDYNPISVTRCLQEILLVFKTEEKTRYGVFKLSARIGFAKGSINWGIVGTNTHKLFYFNGEAIDKSIDNEKNAKKLKILTDPLTAEEFKDFITFKMINSKKDKVFYEVENFDIKNENNYSNTKKDQAESYFISQNFLKLFFSNELIHTNVKGEFRPIVSIFISINSKNEYEEINEIVSIIAEAIDKFEGYFNKIDFTDKGFTAIIFFGFPVSFEDNITRAIKFIANIKDRLKDKIKVGITTGIAYSGLLGNSTRCEYTCLGDIVNLSSRIMVRAKINQILVTKDIANKIKDEFNITSLGFKKFKGKKEKVEIFEIKNKKIKQLNEKSLNHLIGREKELQKLEDYIKSSSSSGKFILFFLYGEAGIGKSRLIYEIISKYKESYNFFIFQSDNILKKSLNPFEYMLKNYFQVEKLENEKDKRKIFDKIYDALLDKLNRLLDTNAEYFNKELQRSRSFIASLLGIYYENSPYQYLDPKGRHENTIYALSDFIKANSLLKPLVLIFEDYNYTDSDTIEVLDLLIRTSKELPIKLIISSRLNDDGSKPQIGLESNPDIEELLLENLAFDKVQLLIDSQFKNSTSKRLKDFIINKTPANPFYIEQFCLYLKENNLVIETKNGYDLKSIDVDIPSSINSILLARIDRLSADLKESVQLASVIGMEFEIEILKLLSMNLITDINYNKLDKIVLDCERQRIWYSASDVEYIFQHALLRQVAYEMQLKQRLIDIHRLIGSILERLFKDRPDKYFDIAYNFDKGENIEKAIFYYEKSAQYLKDNYKNNELLNVYDRLINLLTDIRKKIEIIVDKAYVLELTGKWDEAIQFYKKAIELSQSINDKALLCKSEEFLASLEISKGNYEYAFSLLKGAENLLQDFQSDRQYTFILKDYGNIYANQGEYETALKYFEKMKDICIKINDKSGYSIAIEYIGNIYADQGYYEKALEYYTQKKNICLELKDKRGYSIAIGNIGLCYNYRNDLDNALKCHEERKKICYEIGDRTGYAIAVGNVGNIYKDNYEYSKALKCYQEIGEIFLSMGDKRRYTIVLNNIGHIYMKSGYYENALNNFEMQKELCDLLQDKRGYVTALSNIAFTLKLQGKYEDSLNIYEKTISIAKILNLEFHLQDIYQNMADIFFEIKDYNKAKTYNDLAYEIVNKIQYEAALSQINILKYKIEKNITGLLNLLNTLEEDEDKASIYYFLYKIEDDNAKKEDYRVLASNLYKNLFKKSNFILYKKFIDELEKGE